MGIWDAIGGFGSQILAGFQNKQAEEREYDYKMDALREGPSAYKQGMEAAGMNPLLMGAGGGMPPTVGGGPGPVRTAKSDPAQAMMAGVAISKAASEIGVNRSQERKNEKDTEATDQSIRLKQQLHPLKMEAQRIANSSNEAREGILKVELAKAKAFGMQQAELELLRDSLAYAIERTAGIEKAIAEVVALKLANELREHDIEILKRMGVPSTPLDWLNRSWIHAKKGIEDFVEKASGEFLDSLGKGGDAIRDQAQKASAITESLWNALTEGIEDTEIPGTQEEKERRRRYRGR